MTEIRGETGAQRALGYVIDVGDPDSARCWLDVTEDHTNRHAVLHGGIASLLLDSAMGATGSLTVDPAGRAPFLTVSLTTQFLAPARAGDRVTATGRITGGGRSILFIAGQLTTDNGTLIATATGVFKRVPERTG
ncbi:PaaI family thioesterase [Roseivivax isoporae]|uniref:PaaI family thioesterase n=1 Tax=Roseivivax isoporae TaxID=591206 RepID=UPI0004B7262A|nr:PaaI family thioesterase [Roseivivax isoporae]